MIDEKALSVDEEVLINIAKPLFYGYTFLAGVMVAFLPNYAGTMSGIAVMAAVSFISAGISDALSEDWNNFMQLISVVTLLGSVLAAAYMAALLSVVCAC